VLVHMRLAQWEQIQIASKTQNRLEHKISTPHGCVPDTVPCTTLPSIGGCNSFKFAMKLCVQHRNSGRFHKICYIVRRGTETPVANNLKYDEKRRRAYVPAVSHTTSTFRVVATEDASREEALERLLRNRVPARLAEAVVGLVGGRLTHLQVTWSKNIRGVPYEARYQAADVLGHHCIQLAFSLCAALNLGREWRRCGRGGRIRPTATYL